MAAVGEAAVGVAASVTEATSTNDVVPVSREGATAAAHAVAPAKDAVAPLIAAELDLEEAIDRRRRNLQDYLKKLEILRMQEKIRPNKLIYIEA